jgi:competence protein ComEA
MIDLNISYEQKRGLAIIFALSIGIASFYFLNSRPNAEIVAVEKLPAIVEQVEPTKLIVNVAGKVTNPGVYQLPSGARVVDAIQAAGNQLKGVDISDINLARVLVDGEQILVGGRS